MKYPSRNNYGTFVKYPDKFLLDSILQKGKPVTQANNPNLLISYNGGKAVVYEIKTNSKKYALKCWTEDLGDLKIRYKAIDEHLKKIQLPYFVDFAYQEQGILVDGKKFPIVRMEWVEGINFKEFISTNINNPASIYNFAERFLDMVKILHQHQISHGDLQHGNIIVCKNTDLCLIDYDSLYVPLLSNETDNIKGLPGYQHPSRSKLQKLSPKVDYFSELVIYLSLLVLSENPKYWQQIEAEERLIFSEQDLSKPNSSKILKELKNLSPKIVYLTQELEKFFQEVNIENLEPLENLVANYTGAKISWDFVPSPNPTQTTSSPSIPISNSNQWVFPTPASSSKSSLNQPSQQPQANFQNVTSSDPWTKLDSTPSNIWDKLDSNKVSTQTDWDKLTQGEQPVPIPDENIWDKFDNIWNKFTTSVSSIWHKILNWFN